MITHIKISNFQCHKSLRLRLSPGVTCVTGQSDTGKSAIVRALRWAMTNRPGGAAFIRTGAKRARVTIHCDGHKIVRTRGAANTYTFDDRRLVSFGANVPDIVAKTFCVGSVNFQNQYDAPFWFSQTPGDVSRELNAIINLGEIDTVLANLSAQSRAATAERSVIESRLTAARSAVRENRIARTMDRDLAKIEQMAAASIRQRTKSILMRDLVTAASEHTRTAQNAAQLTARAAIVTKTGDRWARLVRRRDALADLIDLAADHRRNVRRPIPDASGVIAAHGRHAMVERKRDALAALVFAATTATNTRDTAEHAAATAQREFTKAIGDTCPLCDQPTNKPHRHPHRRPNPNS